MLHFQELKISKSVGEKANEENIINKYLPITLKLTANTVEPWYNKSPVKYGEIPCYNEASLTYVPPFPCPFVILRYHNRFITHLDSDIFFSVWSKSIWLGSLWNSKSHSWSSSAMCKRNKRCKADAGVSGGS